MQKEGVYEYIIDNIKNILEQGIDYYKDDSVTKDKLIRYYEFINEEDKEQNKFSKIFECNNITNKQSNYNTNEKNTLEIKALSDSFMSKLTNIKISVLNLENDLSLYYKEDNVQEKEVDLDATGVIKPIKITEKIIVDESSDTGNTSIFDIFKKKK